MRAVREYLEAVLVAILLALFAKAFVFEAFEIPSASMEDTLLVGDVILVDKFVYAPHVGPWAALLPYSEPRNGEVFVFRSPEEPEIDFVKRVAGLPGDQVELRANVLTRNGNVVAEPWLRTVPEVRGRLRPDWGPTEVPGARFVALGDSRDNSRDTRFWGFVPRDALRGRAVAVLWSWNGRAGAAYAGRGARFRRFLDNALHFWERIRIGRTFRAVR